MAYARYTKKTWTKPAPVARVKSTRTPSEQQQAIINAAITQSNMVVMALPGTGKSSTLEFVYDAIGTGKRVILLAFNKAIETELTQKGLPAKTFHSLGFGAVSRFLMSRNGGVKMQVDGQKCRSIFDQTLNHSRQLDGACSAVLKLVSLMKAHCLRPNAHDNDIMSLVTHFDVSSDDENVTDTDVIRMARTVLSASNADDRTVDFDDMIYLPWLHNLKLDTFDVVMVDESQDTNLARLELVKRISHATTQVIVVGDKNQAIYGFTGAMHDSMERLTDAFQCTPLPLTVTYRCSKAVVAHAQELIPDYRAIDTAPEGSVRSVASWKMADFLPTDMVLCRNNAPLVGVAYRMLAARIPCKIMGREIGAGLVNLIKRLAGKSASLETLSERVQAFQAKEVSKALAARKESTAQAITDKCESITTIIDSMTPDDLERGVSGLISIIEGMFSDNGPRVTTLATIHKSKGLEAPRVFLLDSELIYSKYSRQDWQQIQDRNLDVVARTRAITELVYVASKTIA
jgi:superfamily I DNA/RNA helicase